MLICNHTTFHHMKVCVQHHISLIYNSEIINIISIIYSFEDILIDNRKEILFSNQKSEKVIMIHPQVHLRIPCYDFSFLYLARFTQILHSKLILTKEQKQVYATNPKISPDQTSVGATGGVYKGQGRNQRKLLTCAY